MIDKITDDNKKIKLHFERFEFKYLITAEKEKEIKKWLKNYTVRDPFAENTADGSYEVCSLYYDSPAFYHYYEKIDGVRSRKKIRLRTYRNGGEFAKYSFFEIKRKCDNIILKDRIMLSGDEYAKFVESGNFDHLQHKYSNDGENPLNEFEWESRMRVLSPKVLINYTREPYIGRFNKDLRITFDKKIRAIENDDLFYSGDDYTNITEDLVVMELKFNGILPYYVNDVIKNLELERTACSKYCNAVDFLSSLPGRYKTKFNKLKIFNVDLLN
jgi:hypothetical protein